LFAGGTGVVSWASLLKVLAAIFISPVLGLLGAMLLLTIVYRVFFRVRRAKTTPLFKNLQRLSAIYMAFSHGRNDAQKPMGVLAMALAVHYGSAKIEVRRVAEIAVAGWRPPVAADHQDARHARHRPDHRARLRGGGPRRVARSP
jgi:phosphate/sulfate permease